MWFITIIIIIIMSLFWWCVAGAGYRARDAAGRASRVTEVTRVEASAASGEMLVSYLLADQPVVIPGAVSEKTLARLRETAFWAPGRAPKWFLEYLGSLEGSLSYANVSRWGCRRTAKQCSVAWWYSGASPSSWRKRGAPAGGGSGAYIHTDALCVPSWSLQVEGSKEWTFARRTRAENAVPIGDEFFGTDAYATTLRPGDLMLFFNGWHPHSTNPVAGEAFTASVHGVVSFDDLPSRLWGRDGVRAKLNTSLATPSTRLFCPGVREFGGFDATEPEPDSLDCPLATPSVSRTLGDGPFDRIAADLGYLSAPAAGDFDGDGDLDLLVAQGHGPLSYYENVGDPQNPRYERRRDLRLQYEGRVLHPAPAVGPSGVIAVGLYDGAILFVGIDGLPKRPNLETNLRRPAPLFYDADGRVDLLVGSEEGNFLLYRGPAFEEAISLDADDALRRSRVVRLAAGSVGPATILVADGAIPLLRYAAMRDAKLVLVEDLHDSPLKHLSLDALNDFFPVEVAAYPSPLLADFDGDGVDDLLLGGLYGSLLWFPGAHAIPASFRD